VSTPKVNEFAPNLAEGPFGLAEFNLAASIHDEYDFGVS
jgi:hypothetical protein